MSRTSLELQPLPLPVQPSTAYAKPRRESVAHSIHSNQTQDRVDVNDVTSIELSIAEAEESTFVTSRSGTLIIILSTTLVTGIGSMLNGMVTVSLPQLATDLDLQASLQLW